MPFLLFYVTHPDETAANRVANHLLDQKLIACANVFPITSAYWWQGAVQREGEWISILKTRPELEARLEAEIEKIHPYKTPCILRFEVRANAAYENWIFESTNV